MEKCVLITGSATGIGKACAKKFAKEGFNLLLVYNNSEKEANILKQELSKFCKVELYKCNFENPQEIQNMYKHFKNNNKKIDVLVNNAGISYEKLLIDQSDEDIIKMIQINLTSQILNAKYASKLMLENGGSIINISSIYGLYGGACESVYSATKGGLISFTKALAKELGSANIRVNAICPGAIDTKMNSNLTKQEIENFSSNVALGRFGYPIEVANTIYFLASEDASYITGAILSVDGGY